MNLRFFYRKNREVHPSGRGLGKPKNNPRITQEQPKNNPVQKARMKTISLTST